MKHYKSARPADLDRHTDQSFWEVVDRVAARSLTENKAQFALTQQIYGIRYEPDSLSCDISIRPFYKPISSLSWDWMHVFLTSSGLMQFHANEFIHDLLQRGVSMASLDAQLIEFQDQNKQCMRPLCKDFLSSRVHAPRSDHGHLRAFAGEMITVFAFLMYYVSAVVRPAGALQLECQAVEVAFAVLEFLRGGQSNVSRVPDLRRLLEMYHDLLSSCYSAQIRKIKSHLMHHVPDSIQRSGYLLSCFSNERRHRLMIGATAHFRQAGARDTPASKYILARLLVDLEERVRRAQFKRFCLVTKPRDCTNIFADYFPPRRRPSTILWAICARLDTFMVRINNVVCAFDGQSAETYGRVKLVCEVTFPDTFSPDIFVLIDFMVNVAGPIFRESGNADFVHAQNVHSVHCTIERESGTQILFKA